VTVLAIARGPLSPEERNSLERAAGSQASVVEVWSPPGVRVLWTQCRGGEGVHTWPQTEMVEVCEADGTPVTHGEEGELVWTGLGWRGTVLVRLATGARGRVVEGACSTCGRTTPRILDPTGGPEFEATESSGALVSPTKATGAFESVRTVKTARKDRSTMPARVKDDVVPEAEEHELGAPWSPAHEPAAAVRAVPKDDPVGTVRAVAKEAAVDADESSWRPADRASAIGAVDHLPPVPEVGPDAAGGDPTDDGLDPWLPDTGEIDAWPAPVLASIDGLAAWQVEHRRRRGHDELVVHLALADGAELGEVLVSLERSIGATQYVVGDEAGVNARVAAADGRRVVDRRIRRTADLDGAPRATVSTRRSPRVG